MVLLWSVVCLPAAATTAMPDMLTNSNAARAYEDCRSLPHMEIPFEGRGTPVAVPQQFLDIAQQFLRISGLFGYPRNG